MKRQSFEVHLESEVAVGMPGSVNGGRDTLDYLPGSLFMGAAAARLYNKLGEHAFAVFHAGKVRFGDGLPLDKNGGVAYPMPQSLALRKQIQRPYDTPMLPAQFLNQGFDDDPAARGKSSPVYLSPAGEAVRPRTQYRLKTAVDPRSGVAMAHQLYGYHSLLPHQRFGFTLDADDDLPQAVFDRLVATLGGVLRLGRSRSAEYGRCRAFAVEPTAQPSVAAQDGCLTVLLLSHLVVEDGNGRPVALPESTDLGLPAGERLEKRCFVRHRSYPIYNGFYNAFERDLIALERGSVLCYRLAPADMEAVLQQPERYAGLQQQRGFGRLLLNPPMLTEPQPNFDGATPSSACPASSAPIARPNHPLAAWLVTRAGVLVQEEGARSQAEGWYGELGRLMRGARVRAGLPQEIPVGPTPAQWGRVRDAALQASVGSDVTRLRDALFDEEHGICKSKDPAWSQVIFNDALEQKLGRPPTFRDWLAAKLAADEEAVDPRVTVLIFMHFARFASDRAKQQRPMREV